MNIEMLKLMLKYVEIVEGYGHFRPGQDGWMALIHLKRIINEAINKSIQQ